MLQGIIAWSGSLGKYYSVPYRVSEPERATGPRDFLGIFSSVPYRVP